MYKREQRLIRGQQEAVLLDWLQIDAIAVMDVGDCLKEEDC